MDFHLLALVLAGLAILFLSGTESASCPTGTVAMNVTSPVDVQNVADVMNCTGQGDFDITWYSNVTLNETIEISDLKIVTMTGIGFPTIHGGLYDEDDGGALVNVGGGTGIFSVSGGSKLSLTNLVLEGGNTEYGAAVNLLSSSYLFAYDCMFFNNNASIGGAIYASNSSVDVHGSTTFTNNYALHGGALYARTSNISIGGNTSFSRNTAEGSSVTSTSITSFSSTSYTSTWTYSDSSGGAIYAEDSRMHMDGDCSFADNSAEYGGAMYVFLSDMSMPGDIMFANNSAVDDGGAMYVFSSNMSMPGGIMFANNSAVDDGGAIYVQDSTMHIDGDCFFDHNNASYGGAVLGVSSNMSLEGNVMFANNHAGDWGGAVLGVSSNMSFEGNVMFANNHAGDRGGAVLGYLSIMSMEGNVMFANNHAEDSGGAMYVFSSDMFMPGDIMFANNSAVKDGGAVRGILSNMSMEGNIMFAYNQAFQGGAVFGSDSNMPMKGNIMFANNSAELQAGAMYVFISEASMDGNISFVNNLADVGGAMFVEKSEMYMEGINIFAYNSANIHGGAVYALNSTITMNGSMNQSGYLAGNEGYLEVKAGPELPPKIRFIGNAAVGLGGAMHVVDTVELECTGVALELNSAQLGGAIYVVSTGATSTQFTSCVFERNKAQEGGAIYLSTGSGVDRFTSSVFRDNFAHFSGGAIFHTGFLQVVNTRFELNMAGVEGPAIISIGLIQKLSNVYFSENSFYCWKAKYGYVVRNEDSVFSTSDFDQADFDEVCARCSTGHLRDGKFQDIRTNGKPVCEEPPTGTTAESSGTTVATLTLEKGYYRISHQSHDILKCYQPDACVGGNDAATYCAPGYNGPYCAVCVDGYTPGIGYSCYACSGDIKRSAVGRAIAGGFAVLLVAALLFAYLGRVVRDGDGEDTAAARRSWRQKCWSCQSCLVKVLPLRAIKIVVTVWQIISQFGAIAGDVYPEVLKAFVSTLTPINLDLDVVLSYSCIITTDFYDRLLLATIVPALVIVTFAGSYLVAKQRNSGSGSAMRAVLHKHQAAALYLAFFVYSPVSYKIFQTFACDELDDGNSYLRADYSLSCSTPRHRWYKDYALVMMGVYPLGIAAVFACLLAWYRHDLVKPDRESILCLKPFSGMWAAYKPSRYYYEVAECGRRVAITIIAALVPSDSVTQISLVLMFAVVWVFISEAISPFEKKTEMNLYRWGNAIIVASMYVAFLMKFDVGTDTEYALLTFSGVVILANVFMVVTVLVQTAFLVKELRGAREVVRAIDIPIRRTV